MPLSPGEKLGPYEILALIGAGGMGEVWKAHDPRLRRDVAIKTSAEHFSKRFEREAHAVAALNHPNICQIYDVGPNYLVMEYIEGTPLKGPLPIDQALKFAAQICDALDAAHKKGITHRDLKPGNIMVTASGIKLLDFGLALLSRDCREQAVDATATIGMTQAGTILGTAAYMSPEQAEAKSVDSRSDIFSFGSVLYEMLSGRRAFTGDSAIAIMAAVLHKEPEPLEATSVLGSIIARCLRKSPAERFQSIADVREALLAITSGVGSFVERSPSIAVLPFANMSRDADDEYFSDGLAEEIINALTQVKGLKVIARTSAFAFKGKNEDIRKIAGALGVTNILEGSVRRAGSRLRVTAQLIQAVDGTHLWSQRYDRDMTDVFAIQDEISQAISEALQVRLAPRARTVNIEAYQHYLNGQYHRFRFTPDSLAKAKEYLEQALAIDPNYAPAHSGLAGYYFTLATTGMRPMLDVAPLVISAVEKALAIDTADSQAHSLLGGIAAMVDYDWKAAEQHHRKAMKVESILPTVRFRYVLWYLLPLRRFAEATEQSRLALETDPLSMVLHFGMARSMYALKQYRETVEYARGALEIDANYHLMWFKMGLAQLHGAARDAITSFERVVELAPWWPMGVAALAAACFQTGDRERSQEWAQKLIATQGGTLAAALYHAATSEVEAMFEALDEAHQRRDAYLLYIQSLPFFDPYRADPRFQVLLAKMNLA